MVKTRQMTEQRSQARSLRREAQKNAAWCAADPASRCCPSASAAAQRGCLACVEQMYRVSCSGAAGNEDDNVLNRTACMLAAREGHCSVLAFLLPKLIERQQQEDLFIDDDADAKQQLELEQAALVRDLAVFAAVAGHLDAMRYLHAFFAATFDRRHHCPWNAQLCHLLASNGRVDCLLYALDQGAAWANRADMALRLPICDPRSDQAECCRIAAAGFRQ